MIADDIKLYRVIWSPDDCLQLQHYIDVLVQWSKRWLLLFNVTKCKVLHIGNPTATSTCYKKLHLDDIHDHGIIIDSKLKFHAHSDSVTN